MTANPGRPAQPPQLSVVLPAHNEIGLLGSTVTNLVTALSERGHSFEIVIVENGSHDGTLHLARLLAEQFATVRVLALARGDYGAALAAGFASCLGTTVVNFDVDYYDLAFLDAALVLLEGGDVDLVLASKRAPGARDDRPLVRRVLTAGFTAVLRAGLGLTVSDAHGMKACKRESLAPVVDECRMRQSMFDVEMVLRAQHHGLGVAEIPARVVERRPPRTPIGRRTIESALGIAQLRVVLLRESVRRRASTMRP